jgi:hypothetical protein
MASLNNLMDSVAKLVNNYPYPNAQLKREEVERQARLAKPDPTNAGATE